jgi:hypothetical protein
MKPFKEVSGHLIEHAVSSVMLGKDVEGLRGLWRGECVEWIIEGTPGETRRMLAVLRRAFQAGASITEDVLVAEWSRVQLEGRLRRDAGLDAGEVTLVQKLLAGEVPTASDSCGLDLPAEPDMIASWLGELPAAAHAWVRPERALLVIIGPDPPLRSLEYAREAFRPLPSAEPVAESLDTISEPPAPKRILRQYTGDAPVPTIYAWGTPYLGVYRGALSLLMHSAHYEAMRLSAASGLAYWIAAGPAAHHLWCAAWCLPQRVDDTLAMLRCALMASLDRLTDPRFLVEARRRRARQKFRDYMAFSRAAASSYAWLRRLHPEATDPFTAHLREIVGVTVDDMFRLREQYRDESLVTTVEYRRPD